MTRAEASGVACLEEVTGARCRECGPNGSYASWFPDITKMPHRAHRLARVLLGSCGDTDGHRAMWSLSGCWGPGRLVNFDYEVWPLVTAIRRGRFPSAA